MNEDARFKPLPIHSLSVFLETRFNASTTALSTARMFGASSVRSAAVSLIGFLTLALLGGLAAPSRSNAMDLAEYMQAVEANHRGLKSIGASATAVEDLRVEGDLELTPSMILGASYTDDKRAPNQLAQFGGYETKTTAYTASLNKKFSSGTLIGLSANAYQIENPGVNLPTASPGTTGSPFQLPPGLYFDKFSTASLGINFTQSLWKNFFGRATRLRWERENQNAAAQNAQYDLQRKQILTNAETAYWDFIYATEDFRLVKLSLERSQKIESWTERRTNDGISDLADLLQAKALVVQRKLQLQASEDNFRTAKKAVADALELREGDPFPNIVGDIAARRNPQQMVQGRGHIVQIESYIAALNAKAAQASQSEAEDNARPDLSLQGGYATNSYEQSFGTALKHADDPNRPTTNIGIKFTYLFDDDAKSAVLTAYRQQALASRWISERKMVESESAWEELKRKYADLSGQIETAQSLSSLQSRRAHAQSEKFNKGRSVTTDVVYAEQDANDAELNLAKLQAQQRKLEATGRLFVGIKE